MTYRSLMVHLNLGVSNDNLLVLTADIAAQFDARVIGIVASQPLIVSYGEGYFLEDLNEQDRIQVERAAHEAEVRFHELLQGKVREREWRASICLIPNADYIAEQARTADLIIASTDSARRQSPSTANMSLSSLVMHAGRPVLIAPPDQDRLNLENVLIGWKDSRETRRAVNDALPLLRKARRVTVVEITSADDALDARARLADVVVWLKHHGITAHPEVLHSTGDDAALLDAMAQEKAAGLIIAGAYGHTRLHEWVLGGITRDLLLHPRRCALVSH